jgi:hypothetical protein
MIKFAIIQCDSFEEFTKCLNELDKKFGVDKAVITPTKHGEVSGKVFVKMMQEKGYKVSSQRAKTARCKFFNIRRTKRGKEWWYKLDDIELVPLKCLQL